jgi:hypothetical protein
MGRPVHGKLFNFFYFLKCDSFDSDRSAMHKNDKIQSDLQGLVQNQKLTLSYDNGYRAFFRGWKPLLRETVDSCGCYVPASRYTCQSGRCSKNRYANEYAPEHLEIHTCRPR